MSFYKTTDRLRLSGKPAFRSDQRHTLFRDEFHDDVARLVHSPSYRRLDRKRQLLPYINSDFVRNRLTHSNEVAQIATSIGNHLNNQLKDQKKLGFRINTDILVFAGLAHDIGHPPFGHLGEVALNAKMLDSGGFEGNAQSLRVVARLEKRLTSHDVEGDRGLYSFKFGRHGLNVTYRSLASILKYNSRIPVVGFDQLRLAREENKTKWEQGFKEIEALERRLSSAESRYELGEVRKTLERIDALSEWQSDGEHPEPKVSKGYYDADSELVSEVLRNVFGDDFEHNERTQSVECQIMDFADDVAYSIYDLEDCLKTGVIDAERLLSLSTDHLLRIGAEVAEKIFESHERGKISDTSGKSLDPREIFSFVTPDLINEIIFETLGVLFDDASGAKDQTAPESFRFVAQLLRASRNLSHNGEIRRKLADFHILHCCASARIKLNEQVPAASIVSYPLRTHVRIELLKRLNFHLVINSDLIQTDEHRGAEIFSSVFDGLYLPCDEFKLHGHELTGYRFLPEAVRKSVDNLYEETLEDVLVVRKSITRTRGVLIDKFTRMHPSVRTFSLKRMLRVRDFDFRYSLAISIYEQFLSDSLCYSQRYAAIRSRRTRIKRLVCDYIASMTDRGLEDFHRRLKYEDNRIVIDDSFK